MSSDRGILSRLFGQPTGGLLGGGLPANFVGPVQPPVQASPSQAPRGNTLFQNPAFLGALSRFGQRLATPTQAGQASGLVQGLGGFAPDLIAGQAQQAALQQQQSQQDILNRLREAQIGGVQATTAQTLAATERVPASRILEREKQDLAERKFDQDVREFDASLKKQDLTPDQQRLQANKLRGEFTTLSKDYIKVRDAAARIEASAKDPSAAGDLALIFNFMKVLDPGSTVREGEFATAAASAGLGDRFIAAAKKVDSGQRLSTRQRNDFVNRGRKLFAAADQQHNKRVQTFTDLAVRNRVDPQNVTIDLGAAEQQAQAEQQAERIPTGQTIFTPAQIQAEMKRRGL